MGNIYENAWNPFRDTGATIKYIGNSIKAAADVPMNYFATKADDTRVKIGGQRRYTEEPSFSSPQMNRELRTQGGANNAATQTQLGAPANATGQTPDGGGPLNAPNLTADQITANAFNQGADYKKNNPVGLGVGFGDVQMDRAAAMELASGRPPSPGQQGMRQGAYDSLGNPIKSGGGSGTFSTVDNSSYLERPGIQKMLQSYDNRIAKQKFNSQMAAIRSDARQEYQSVMENTSNMLKEISSNMLGNAKSKKERMAAYKVMGDILQSGIASATDVFNNTFGLAGKYFDVEEANIAAGARAGSDAASQAFDLFKLNQQQANADRGYNLDVAKYEQSLGEFDEKRQQNLFNRDLDMAKYFQAEKGVEYEGARNAEERRRGIDKAKENYMLGNQSPRMTFSSIYGRDQGEALRFLIDEPKVWTTFTDNEKKELFNRHPELLKVFGNEVKE